MDKAGASSGVFLAAIRLHDCSSCARCMSGDAGAGITPQLHDACPLPAQATMAPALTAPAAARGHRPLWALAMLLGCSVRIG